MKKTAFAIILTLSVTYLRSQNIDHSGLFPTIDHSGQISTHWEYSLYYFGSFNLVNEKIKGIKQPSEFFSFYAEQALTYHLNDKLGFTGSYVYERQHPFQNIYRNENRFYLQSTYKYSLKQTTIKHRLRFDGRYIQDRITGQVPFTKRLRYLVGLKTPLSHQNDKLYFSAYNEFFFNTFKSAVAIYGENWAFAGVGIKTGKSGSIEVGPLYIFWVNNKQNDLLNFYYLQLAWVTHLDFTKPEKK